MEKANKVLRRSGIRLRAMKSGHTSLKLIISDWKETRKAYKSYITSQETSWSDMISWTANEHNRSVKEVLDHVIQLQALWTDVQTQFINSLKKFQHQFEKILESEHQLDKSRAALNTYEQKEIKLNKEFRKAGTKSCVDDLKQIENKLKDVKITIQNAKVEVASNTTENETVKMLLMKEGLINLSNQYVELAEKTAQIFKAQRLVAETIPDSHSNVQDIKYNGSETCLAAVAQVKEAIMCYRGGSAQAPAPPPYYPPSPYHHQSPFSPTYPHSTRKYMNTSNVMEYPPQENSLPDSAGFPWRFIPYGQQNQFSQIPQEQQTVSPNQMPHSSTAVPIAGPSVHYYDTPHDNKYINTTNIPSDALSNQQR